MRSLTPFAVEIEFWRNSNLLGDEDHDALGDLVPPLGKASIELEGFQQNGKVDAKGGSDGYVPILPALAQELRTHLDGRRSGYLFESNRSDKYTTRYVQQLVKKAAQRAGIGKNVTPHRLRASVATVLLDACMPLDQVQKFLRHKRITTTQIYAETSLPGMAKNYVHALLGGSK